MSIKHPLRKLSKENWEKYGKVRYMVEQLFGSIKQKVGLGLSFEKGLSKEDGYCLCYSLELLVTCNLFIFVCLIHCLML